MKVHNRTRNTLLGDRIEWAGTSERRRRGLLGRDGLAPGEGLYIVPCQWIHMFGMRFAIDVLFLDESGKAVGLHHALPPNRLSKLCWRADGVLELPAGTLRETATELGDRIEFEEDAAPDIAADATPRASA